MQWRRIEIGVGVFILLGILALAFLTIQVSGLSLYALGRDRYHITAQFNNVGGLSERAKVSVAGVVVGQVISIRIDPLTVQAVVEMAIDSSMDFLTVDSVASIKTSGILGEQYVSIAVGGAPELLQDGDRIRDTQSALILEDLIGKFLMSLGKSGPDQ